MDTPDAFGEVCRWIQNTHTHTRVCVCMCVYVYTYIVYTCICRLTNIWVFICRRICIKCICISWPISCKVQCAPSLPIPHIVYCLSLHSNPICVTAASGNLIGIHMTLLLCYLPLNENDLPNKCVFFNSYFKRTFYQ